MVSVYKYDKIDTNLIHIDPPIKNGRIYYSDIKYDNKPLYIQTSTLQINDYKIRDKKGYISFNIKENNLDFYEFVVKLDNYLIKSTYNNSKNWFNQDIPNEVIDDFYKRISKPIEKGKTPNIKFNIPINNNKVLFKLYNQNKEIIDLNTIDDNYDSILILHIRGIKFLKQEYICDCYITQMRVNINNTTKYNIIDKCLIDCNISNDKNVNDDDDIVDYEIIEEKKKKHEKNELNNVIKNKLDEINKLIDEINQCNNKLNIDNKYKIILD